MVFHHSILFSSASISIYFLSFSVFCIYIWFWNDVNSPLICDLCKKNKSILLEQSVNNNKIIIIIIIIIIVIVIMIIKASLLLSSNIFCGLDEIQLWLTSESACVKFLMSTLVYCFMPCFIFFSMKYLIVQSKNVGWHRGSSI